MKKKLEHAATNFDQEEHSATVVPIAITRNWLAIAASVAILLVASYFLFTPSQSSSDQLFAEVFEQPNTIRPIFNDAARSSITNTDLINQANVLWQSAENAYQQKDYRVAKQHLTALLKLDIPTEEKSTTNLKLGLIALMQDKADEAIVFLKQSNPDEDTRWYMALAFLKLNQQEKALEAFEDFLKKGGGTQTRNEAANKTIEKLLKFKSI